MASAPPPAVSLANDADILTPAAMARRLCELTEGGETEPDYYGNGGAVARFESKVAALLGKERAVMFPTGTLANLIALRLLAGTDGGRVIVHRESHLFNDSGENLSLLGGLTMVPLAGRGAGFSAEALAAEIDRATDARVASRVCCVAVESPSRRLFGARFPPVDLEAVVATARRHAIPLFLDGARMLIEAAYTDRTPASLAAPFDIVYLSLYKYLGAPFGCVIAGEAARLDNAFHERRRFGGGLYQMWPAAILAEDRLDGQLDRWRRVKSVGSIVIDRLEVEGTLTVERVAEGTNVVFLRCRGAQLDSDALEQRGCAHGLKFPKPVDGALPIKLNETWLRADPTEMANRIIEALS